MDLDLTNQKENHTCICDSFSKELQNHINKINSKFSIDRFEDKFAVCENLETHEMINIEKDLLPDNCKEGSIIKLENNQYILDETETQEKQAEIKNLVNNLFKKK